VDRAPLPPHERPWRHPSELGPPEHEPTSTSGRVLIVTTATLSLLLIGLLALSMTPGRGADPVAVEATTDRSATPLAALEQPPLPMVTPLGDEGWAVTTSDAVGRRVVTMAARLPTGDVVEVEIVQRDAESGVTLVSLPTLTRGYELATSSPAPSDTVVVHGADPLVVALVDVAGLDVAEGTPVLDDDGALVGICTHGVDGISVMTVSTMPGSPTVTSTSVPGPSTSVVATVTSAVAVTTTPPGPSATVPTPTTVGPSTTPPPVTTAVPPTVAPATTTVSGGVVSTTAAG
jgi:hypothetical protein